MALNKMEKVQKIEIITMTVMMITILWNACAKSCSDSPSDHHHSDHHDQALCAKTEGCGWFNHSTAGCFLKTARVNYDSHSAIKLLLKL